MIYLWVFLGLIIAIVLLGVANIILTKVKKKRLAKLEQEKGEN